MENILRQFANDEHTREAVEEFLSLHLEQLAIARVFSKEDTSGIADAKEVIDNAFITLVQEYTSEKKPEPVNSAR